MGEGICVDPFPWFPGPKITVCPGVPELAHVGSRELIVMIFPQLYVLLLHVGSLKSAMVGVLTPWWLANTTSQGFGGVFFFLCRPDCWTFTSPPTDWVIADNRISGVKCDQKVCISMCLFSEVGRQGVSTPHSSQLYVYRLLHICDAVRKSMKLKEENSHLL